MFRNYQNREDLEWSKLAQQWIEKKSELLRIEAEEKTLREELIRLSDNNNAQGAGITLTHYTRKGNIDYSTIPILKEIDLEPYRKPSCSYCVIKPSKHS